MNVNKFGVSGAEEPFRGRDARVASPWPWPRLILSVLLVPAIAVPLLWLTQKPVPNSIDFGERVVVHPLPARSGQDQKGHATPGAIPDEHPVGCVPAAGPKETANCTPKTAYDDTWDGYWSDFSGPGWSEEWADD